MSEYAVVLKNACKSYGQKKILDGLDMEVPRGCIYALLGSSGCGKTTLLGCILGTKQLDSGSVWTLGGKPCSPQSGVPGPKVGYMPQETSLVAEFTVRDAIYYFGRILKISDDLIEGQYGRLKELLQLPPDVRFLRNCSGGELRRVSLACALVHNPELLILDEPTVGLDPVLRQSIWDFLVDLTQKNNTAVILTTHYIEEATHAHKIGLMRNGKLVAEDSPHQLLDLYSSSSLEEVFLILSIRQDEDTNSDQSSAPHNQPVRHHIDDNYQSGSLSTASFDAHNRTVSLTSANIDTNRNCRSDYLNTRRVKSLLSKNMKQFLRNSSGVIFTFTFPLLQIGCFLIAIGGHIRDMPLGVVNKEGLDMQCGNYSKVGTVRATKDYSCEFRNLGCRFLDEAEDPMINFVYYDNIDDAIEEVKHGNLVGVLQVSLNFTQSFEARLDDPFGNLFNSSQIRVWLDMSNQQIGESIKYKLMQKFLDFQRSALEECQLNPKLGDVPLRFNYEYGHVDDDFTTFAITGFLVGISAFLGCILTVSTVISDRLEGVWERSIVAGVTALEITLSHLLVQLAIVCLQTIILMLLTFVLFGIEYHGSFMSIYGMLLLQGLCGMALGFLFSVVTDSVIFANLSAVGIFYPIGFLCGILWPLEAQPIGLRYVSTILPFTLPTIALRSIVRKGEGIDNPEVLTGLVVSFTWLFVLIATSVLGIRRKR